jgi:hypothetical protein
LMVSQLIGYEEMSDGRKTQNMYARK